jgi:hypothetical protein
MARFAAARRGSIVRSGPTRHLDVQSASSAAYLAAIEQAQARAVSQLKRAYPVRASRSATGSCSTASPPSRPPSCRAAQAAYVHRIHPTMAYTQNPNRSRA